MDSAQPDAVKEELTRYIANHLYRVTANLRRVDDLIRLARSPLTQHTREDILRAAVVFLHATLEDFLRYVGLKYLPTADEAILDKISLVGSSDVLRAEKFFLGKLTRHRGKTIDQLIAESVASYLDKMSFSDPTDISRLLEGCGVSLDHVRQSYPAIGELMARRHQIVHRADLMDSQAEGPRNPASIQPDTVSKWNATVMEFISRVIAEKIGQDFGPRLAEAKRQTSNQAMQRTAPPSDA